MKRAFAICLGILPQVLCAEALFYDRVTQVVEIRPGVFRDVSDVFATDTTTRLAQRLTHAAPGKEYDSSGAQYDAGLDRIVFYSFRHRDDLGNGNTGEIYTMQPDGSGQTRLTTDAVDDAFPTWCGGEILFVRDGGSSSFDLYTMAAEDLDGDGVGDNLAPVLTSDADEYDPSCSPDGRKMAYVTSDMPGHWRIAVAKPDGSDQVILTTAPGLCGAPKWSPDGQWLIYQCDHHDPQSNNQEIYRMRPWDVSPMDGEGDERERLTMSPAGSAAYTPVWSPSGDGFAFTQVTGPTNASYWQVFGSSDAVPIPGVAGRTFLSDWK